MGICRRCCRYTFEFVSAVGVAVAVAVFSTFAALLASSGTRDLDLTGHLLLLVASFALVARHRTPRLVLAVTAACVLVYQAHGYPGFITTLPVLVAVYTAVAAGHRRDTVIIVAGALLTTSAAMSLFPDQHRAVGELAEIKLLLLGWMVAGGVMAEMARHRRAYTAEVEQRAFEAERTREETARRRATEERLRIARELHDSLTHNISIVKVHAGVAIHLARKNHQEVPPALLAIDEASADAIRELRSTLGALRGPGQAGLGHTDRPGTDGEHSGLHRLAELVERTCVAGFPTTVSIEGEPRPLPAPVDRAAYRIVQEALTNVARHAGPASARVAVTYATDTVAVRVDDDGRGAAGAAPAPGVGLLGMRERVDALGGRLHTEAPAGGGFSVHAELPAPARSAVGAAP